MAKTIVGLYDDFTAAEKVVRDLVASGFPRDRISLVANNATGEYDQYETASQTRQAGDTHDVTPEEGAGIGAGIGAAIGGLGGLLMGIGLLAVPGVGPALAAGPIVSMLVGAGIGAAAGGVAGALVNMGVPEEEAGYYAEGVRRGGTLVTIDAPDDMADQAVDIMDNYDPIDIQERAETWQSSGWTRYDPEAAPYTSDEVVADRKRYQTATKDKDGKTALPVVEEELKVGKREVRQGSTRVRSYITEQPVSEDVRLREEKVTVERRPVNRPVDQAELDTFREGTVELTETAEEAVVTKQARVIEEVVIGKEVTEHVETIHDTVRRTDVDVEQDTTASSDFNRYDTDFRKHYNTNYATSGYTYEQYMPVYRYGYNLGTNSKYRGKDWKTVETDARRHWEEGNPGTWDQFKDSIRHAWERVR